VLVEEPAREHRAGARMSALSGLVFAVLLVVALVLVRQAPGLGVPDSTYADFYAAGHGSVLVTAGLYIVPFAGIAFLWFLAVLRRRIGRGEDQFFSTVFLGSGLLFIAMLFAADASARPRTASSRPSSSAAGCCSSACSSSPPPWPAG